MITSLRIEHFKAAASVTVPLGPITVLIGPNDSGKSTILQALMALSRAGGSQRLGVEQLLDCPAAVAATDQDTSLNVGLEVEGTGYLGFTLHGYQYRLALSTRPAVIVTEEARWNDQALLTARYDSVRVVHPTSERVDSWPGISAELGVLAHEATTRKNGTTKAQFQAIAQDLKATLLRLDSRAIAQPCPLGTPLLADGSGLVGIVDDLLTSGVGEDKIARANEVIRKLSPHVKGVAAKLHPSGGKELHFALRSGAVIPASQMSDGIVLAAALVLISLGAGTRRLLIEEPENGLHPRQLRIVADTIRSIAAEHGTQIVLTTHSPLLLNHFGAKETLLVTRDQRGVSVRPMDTTTGFDELSTEMSLGELWYNVGDSDLARPA